MQVYRDTLIEAIRGGARTLRQLQEATRAGTGCGTCRIDLLDLLADEAARQDPPELQGPS
ncbi:MAG: (2Fe-2S)-binding protein [Planctomycetota bacterium]